MTASATTRAQVGVTIELVIYDVDCESYTSEELLQALRDELSDNHNVNKDHIDMEKSKVTCRSGRRRQEPSASIHISLVVTDATSADEVKKAVSTERVSFIVEDGTLQVRLLSSSTSVTTTTATTATTATSAATAATATTATAATAATTATTTTTTFTTATTFTTGTTQTGANGIEPIGRGYCRVAVCNTCAQGVYSFRPACVDSLEECLGNCIVQNGCRGVAFAPQPQATGTSNPACKNQGKGRCAIYTAKKPQDPLIKGTQTGKSQEYACYSATAVAAAATTTTTATTTAADAGTTAGTRDGAATGNTTATTAALAGDPPTSTAGTTTATALGDTSVAPSGEADEDSTLATNRSTASTAGATVPVTAGPRQGPESTPGGSGSTAPDADSAEQQAEASAGDSNNGGQVVMIAAIAATAGLLLVVATVGVVVLKRRRNKGVGIHAFYTPKFDSTMRNDGGARTLARMKPGMGGAGADTYSEPEYTENNMQQGLGNEDEELKLDGFLFKYAQGKSGALGAKNWKKRYFQLTNKTLAYYDKPNHDSNNPVGARKGLIQLDQVSAVEMAISIGSPLPGEPSDKWRDDFAKFEGEKVLDSTTDEYFNSVLFDYKCLLRVSYSAKPDSPASTRHLTMLAKDDECKRQWAQCLKTWTSPQPATFQPAATYLETSMDASSAARVAQRHQLHDGAGAADYEQAVSVLVDTAQAPDSVAPQQNSMPSYPEPYRRPSDASSASGRRHSSVSTHSGQASEPRRYSSASSITGSAVSMSGGGGLGVQQDIDSERFPSSATAPHEYPSSGAPAPYMEQPRSSADSYLMVEEQSNYNAPQPIPSTSRHTRPAPAPHVPTQDYTMKANSKDEYLERSRLKKERRPQQQQFDAQSSVSGSMSVQDYDADSYASESTYDEPQQGYSYNNRASPRRPQSLHLGNMAHGARFDTAGSHNRSQTLQPRKPVASPRKQSEGSEVSEQLPQKYDSYDEALRNGAAAAGTSAHSKAASHSSAVHGSVSPPQSPLSSPGLSFTDGSTSSLGWSQSGTMYSNDNSMHSNQDQPPPRPAKNLPGATPPRPAPYQANPNYNGGGGKVFAASGMPGSGQQRSYVGSKRRSPNRPGPQRRQQQPGGRHNAPLPRPRPATQLFDDDANNFQFDRNKSNTISGSGSYNLNDYADGNGASNA